MPSCIACENVKRLLHTYIVKEFNKAMMLRSLLINSTELEGFFVNYL